MSTTVPIIEAEALADLRWLAREAVADAVCVASGSGEGADAALVLRRAWALGAVGLELDEPTPGTGHAAQGIRWPAALGASEVRVLLDAADDLEDRYADATYPEGEGGYSVASRLAWEPLLKRVRRTRDLLEERLAEIDAEDPS